MNVDINKGSLINKNNQFNGNEFCFNKDNSNDKKRQVTSEQKSKDSSFSYFSSLTNWAGSFFSNNEESSKSIFDIYFESPNNNNIKYDSSKSVIENLDNFTQQNQQTRDFIIQVISDENAHLDAIAKALELLESDNSLFNKTSQKDYFTTLTSRLKDKETILKSGEYYFYESLKHAFEDGNTGWYNEHISYNSLFKNALNSYLETFLKEENKAELLKQSGLSQEQSTHIENILNQYEDNIDGHKLLKYALLSSEEITYSEESGIFKRLWDFACKNKGKIATSIFLSMPQIVNTTEGSMPTSENTFSFGRQAVPKNQNPLSNRNTYPLETKKLFLPPPKCPYFRQLGSNYEYMHSMKIDYYPNHWQSDLYNAFREKNLKNAESLLRTNKIMIQDDFNNPILNQAVQVNSTSWVIGSLIERNAFMSEEMGSTLLGDAIKDKLWYEAAILVEHGAKEDLDNSLLTQALESKAEDHEIAQIIDGKAYLGKDAGINLMQQAIKNKQWPIVASLLKRGVKISTNVSIIKLAQSSGANAYDIAGLLGAGAKEGSDDLILKKAIKRGINDHEVKALIDAGASLGSDNGKSFLEGAISKKQWFSIAVLLKAGAKEDPNNLILKQAIESGTAIYDIKPLIDAGANLGSDSGKGLIDLAIKKMQWDSIAGLLKAGVKEDPNKPILKQVIESGTAIYDIKPLINAGASLGSDNGKGLLEFSISKKQWNSVAVLLKAGVKEDPNNLTLKQAIESGTYIYDIKPLIDAGASLGSDNGKVLLDLAIKKMQWDSIAVLLKAGVKEDPNKPILKQAIESGTYIYDIKPLIDAGASLGSDNGKGLIDLAISKKQWKIVELFLKAGATEDPNNLILKQAIESEISIYDIKSLIDTGASLGSDSGKGLLEFAISKKQWGVVELFLKAGAQEDESSSIVEKAISLNIKDKELKNIIQSGAKLGSDNNKNKLFTDFVKRAYWRSSFAILAQDPSLINRVKDLDLAQLESLILHSSGGVSVLKEITKIDERVLKHVNLKKAYTRALNEISYQTLSTIKNAGDAEKLIQSGAVNIDIVTSKAPYGSIAQLYYSKDGPWRELALKYSEESLIRGLQILHSKGDLKQIRPKGKEHVTTIGIVHTNPYSGSFTDNGYRLARRIMNRIDNLEYVIITPDLLTKEVMAQLDGVYLSGGGDNYPQSEFTLNGYPEIKRSSLENHYQNALKLADEEKVPVVGICLGNQQIGLYNGASINKVGFHSSTTVFETNSPTNFFMLTKQQKRKALNDCKITQIKIERVISAHSFAVINPGNKGLKISGKSLTGTSEATYRDLDFFGTQYHPETVSAQAIHYKNKPENNRPLQLRYMYEVTRQFQRRNRFLKTARKVEKAEHKMQAISLSKKYKTLADQALLKRLEHCTTKKDPKSQSDWKNLNVKEFSWEAFDEAYLVKLEEEMTILQKNRAKN